MANQNGRVYPGRNAHLPGFPRDDDRSRDRSVALREDDRAFDERDDPERSWRPEDRGDRGERDDRGFDRGYERRFDARFDRSFDARFDRSFDRGFDRSFEDRPGDPDDRPRWQRRPERFSESDRNRELRVDIQPPRHDPLRSAHRDRDEPSRDRSDGAGAPYGEPAGPRGRIPGARGPHAGKGPVGFQRSDDRIRELVCEALTDDGEVDASHIEVSVKAGEVTLTGAIDDRRMKRLAEDCVEAVPGVKDVHNQLRIGPATAERSGHGDKHERHEPSDKKHRPS